MGDTGAVGGTGAVGAAGATGAMGVTGGTARHVAYAGEEYGLGCPKEKLHIGPPI